MTYVKITDKNGKPIDESNPLPVTGGGTGGSLEVDIVANSAGLATAQGQQDIVDAINNLSDASSEIYTDSVTIDDTGVQLPDLPIGEVIIQNDHDSGQDIYIGNDTDQELRLKVGEWVSVRITNLNLIYAKTTTGTATLRYFARSASGIPGGGSSPVPVQLTGSNVQELLPRQIRSTGFTNNIIKVPYGAKGFTLTCTIHGVTGTLGTNEGLRIRAFLLTGQTYNVNRTMKELNTAFITSGSIIALIHVGSKISENMDSRVVKAVEESGLFYPYFRVDVAISGTFGPGEGFDCESNLLWHY